MSRLGSGYIGTDTLKTSTTNLEIIPTPPSSAPFKKYSLYTFNFLNDQDCTVVVNGETTLFLRAGQGFATNEVDKPIFSFVVKETGITFNWIGGWN